MDFEELKVVWSSQSNEPLFTLNEAALHAIIRRRNEEVHRRAARCQVGEMVGGVVFGLLMIVLAAVLALGDPAWLASSKWIRVPVEQWHAAALFLAGGIMFYYAAYMYGCRRRQLRREEDYASSLRGDLERALAHVDFQIRIARSIVWWGLIPQWVATGLWCVVFFHLLGASAEHYVLIFAVMIAGLAVVVACQQRAITRRYEPRRRELESLRAKLADPQG